jgi:predicted dehydrogenase
VHGNRGSAIIDKDELVYFHSAAGDEEGRTYGASGAGNQVADVLSQYPSDPVGAAAGADPGNLSMAHREQIREFIAAIREDRGPLVTIDEGRKPVALIGAIYESARTGRPVNVR